jgi:hypothetical protein
MKSFDPRNSNYYVFCSYKDDRKNIRTQIMQFSEEKFTSSGKISLCPGTALTA